MPQASPEFAACVATSKPLLPPLTSQSVTNTSVGKANADIAMEDENRGGVSLSEHKNDFDHAMQFAILGAPNSGKSAFRMRAADGIFVDAYVPTTGLEAASRVSTGQQVVVLHLADGPGDMPEGRLRSMAKHADGYFVVFSVTDRASFEGVEARIDKVYSIVQKPLRLILVGNKIDLSQQRCVTEAEGAALAVTIGAEIYFETSCKTGDGIEEVLTFMERLVVNRVELQAVWREDRPQTPLPAGSDGGNSATPSPAEATTPSSAYIPSQSFLDVLQRMDSITDRRHQLLRAVTEGFESDATRQEIYDKCMEQLINGIEVTKYHRRSRGSASRYFWYDPAIAQLCYGQFGYQAGTNHKGVRIHDIAEVRVGTDAHVFRTNLRAPAANRERKCISIIGSHRTLDIQLPDDDDLPDLIPAIKILVDKENDDSVKQRRGKSSWQKAKFLTRRQGRLTLTDIGTLEKFKQLLVRGMMVRHHVVHRIAVEKELWLDEATGRLNVAPSRTSPAFWRKGVLLIDIAEVRAGLDSFVFDNEKYKRHIVQTDMCATIVASECTLDISFVSSTARDLFVQKMQTMLRLIRPEIVTY